jgi:hypothetical protein
MRPITATPVAPSNTAQAPAAIKKKKKKKAAAPVKPISAKAQEKLRKQQEKLEAQQAALEKQRLITEKDAAHRTLQRATAEKKRAAEQEAATAYREMVAKELAAARATRTATLSTVTPVVVSPAPVPVPVSTPSVTPEMAPAAEQHEDGVTTCITRINEIIETPLKQSSALRQLRLIAQELCELKEIPNIIFNDPYSTALAHTINRYCHRTMEYLTDKNTLHIERQIKIIANHCITLGIDIKSKDIQGNCLFDTAVIPLEHTMLCKNEPMPYYPAPAPLPAAYLPAGTRLQLTTPAVVVALASPPAPGMYHPSGAAAGAHHYFGR